MQGPRDHQKGRLLFTAMYQLNRTVIAFDQRGIDDGDGELVNVFIVGHDRRFVDAKDVVDAYLIDGTATLSDVIAYVREKLGQPTLLN